MLALALSQVLAAAPAVEAFTLGNGLRVALRQDDSTPLVAVNLWVRSGSSAEEPQRTGLAHLFEHLMFKGTRRVPDGVMDRLLEEAGGSSNATTTEDWTSFITIVPSNYLELALWLEADRLSSLGSGLTRQGLDNQREVVRNERRQTIDNAPYGAAEPRIAEELYPAGHPYRWPVIGSHDDIAAATLADARSFFQRFYVASNMSLVIAGNLPRGARVLVERYFAGLPLAPAPAPPSAQPVHLDGVRSVDIRDRVQLARVYLVWPSPPLYRPGDAEMDLAAGVLGGGKSSRLYRRLVYADRIAQDVQVAQRSARLGSTFWIAATAKPGRGPSELIAAIDREIRELCSSGPTERELTRSRNGVLGDVYRSLDHVEAVAERTNRYLYHLGIPDALEQDLDRYRRATPQSVREEAERVLASGRVALTVLPQ